VVAVDRLELDRCAACRGIWFDVGEVSELRKLADDKQVREQLQRLLSEHVASSSLADAPALVCPVCALKMVRRHHEDAPGVVVDRCQQHGTWLDQGEAARLLVLAAKQDEARRQQQASLHEGKPRGWFAALLDLFD